MIPAVRSTSHQRSRKSSLGPIRGPGCHADDNHAPHMRRCGLVHAPGFGCTGRINTPGAHHGQPQPFQGIGGQPPAGDAPAQHSAQQFRPMHGRGRRNARSSVRLVSAAACKACGRQKLFRFRHAHARPVITRNPLRANNNSQIVGHVLRLEPPCLPAAVQRQQTRQMIPHA